MTETDEEHLQHINSFLRRFAKTHKLADCDLFKMRAVHLFLSLLRKLKVYYPEKQPLMWEGDVLKYVRRHK